MTYALSWPLQEAVYSALRADAPMAALIGDRIYDAPPEFEADQAPDKIWITLGDERVDDFSTADCGGAAHQLSIAVHAPRRGFAEAKQAAGRVSDVLLSAALSPSRGTVVNVVFIGGRTRRTERDRMRRIELRFRVVVEDD